MNKTNIFVLVLVVIVSVTLWAASELKPAYAQPVNITLAGINFTKGERPYYEHGKIVGITLPSSEGTVNSTISGLNYFNQTAQANVTKPIPIPPTVNTIPTTPSIPPNLTGTRGPVVGCDVAPKDPACVPKSVTSLNSSIPNTNSSLLHPTNTTSIHKTTHHTHDSKDKSSSHDSKDNSNSNHDSTSTQTDKHDTHAYSNSGTTTITQIRTQVNHKP